MNFVFDDEPPMTFEEYDELAAESAIYPGTVIYPALGLASEAGEVCSAIKKLIRDDWVDLTEEDIADQLDDSQRYQIVKEIGDVLWYCSNLAGDLGFTLEEVAEINTAKLKDRMERNKLQGSGDNR